MQLAGKRTTSRWTSGKRASSHWPSNYWTSANGSKALGFTSAELLHAVLTASNYTERTDQINNTRHFRQPPNILGQQSARYRWHVILGSQKKQVRFRLNVNHLWRWLLFDWNFLKENKKTFKKFITAQAIVLI